MGHQFGPEIAHLVLMLALIAALVAFAVWLVNSSRRAHATAGGPVVTPRTVDDGAYLAARMRYARGEISREQFFEIAGDLGALPAAPPAEEPPVE